MKMRHKAVFAVLVAVVAVLLAGCVSRGSMYDPLVSGDFEYYIVKYYMRTKYVDVVDMLGYTGSKTDVIIPDVIEGFPVIFIEGFSKKGITSVTIPKGVTHIGDGAFANNQLASVTIPNSVTEFGKNAFANNRLTAITLSGNNIEIGKETFANNQLASVTIIQKGTGVIKIGDAAFKDNPLTAITIPDSRIEFSGEPFSDNTLYTYLASNDSPAGLYEKKGLTWQRNGEAFSNLKARLVCQRENYDNRTGRFFVYITKIDGVPGIEVWKSSDAWRIPADLNWSFYPDNEIYLDAGYHTIEVAYIWLRYEKGSLHTIYTRDGLEFEHVLTLENGVYDLTATEEGEVIQFQIKRR